MSLNCGADACVAPERVSSSRNETEGSGGNISLKIGTRPIHTACRAERPALLFTPISYVRIASQM